jgi:hypothetical protein
VRGAQVGYPVGGEQGNPFVQVTAHGSRVPRTEGGVPGRFGLGEVTSWLPCGEGNPNVTGDRPQVPRT